MIKTVARLLLIVFVFECVFPTGIAFASVSAPSGPTKPQVNAQGMNLNAFGSANGGAVDLSSGAFTFSRTDIDIPGRNGMDLKVERSYNIKEFKASPKWSKLDGDAFLNYAGEELHKVKWQGAIPAQWGGWIGNGWKTNISGRLLYIKYSSSYHRADWWGSNTTDDDAMCTEIVTIQTGDGSYSFEREFKKNKNGFIYKDDQFVARDKGNKNRLTQGVSGFTLTLQDGRQYLFKEQYYNKRFQVNFYTETSLRSVHCRNNVDNMSVGTYLSSIEDVYGNAIHYEYEKGSPYACQTQTETLDHNPFQNGMSNAGISAALSAADWGLKQLGASMGADVARSMSRVAVDVASDSFRNSFTNQVGFGTDLASTAKSVTNYLSTIDSLKGVISFVKGADGLVNGMMSGVNSQIDGVNKGLSDSTYGVVDTGMIVDGFKDPSKAGEMIARKIAAMAVNVISDAVSTFLCSAIGMPFLKDLLKGLISGFLTGLIGDVQTGSFVATLTLTPMRPIRVYDNAGNDIKISYLDPLPVPQYLNNTEYNFEAESDNASRIGSLTYTGPKGQQTVDYHYDANGCLSEVIKPGKDKETYAYTYYIPNDKTAPTGVPAKKFTFDRTIATASKYDNEGFLLTQVVSNTGITLEMGYGFVEAKAKLSILTDDEDGRFSSFVITSRTLVGRKDANGTATQKWTYEGYDSGTLYSLVPRLSTGQSPQNVMYFKTITVTDPKGGATDQQFEQGLPIQSRNPVGHLQFWKWDFDQRRPLQEISDKNGFRTQKIYSDYDDFGFPQTIEEHGDATATKITKVAYNRSSVLINKNILNRPLSSKIESDGQTFQSIQFEVDDHGAVQSQHSEWGTTQFKHDEFGNVTEVTNPLGQVTQTRYQNGIYPIQTQLMDLKWTTTKTYFPNTLLVDTETNPNGTLTQYTYDDRNRVVSQVTQTGATQMITQIRYDDDPSQLKVTMTTHTSSGSQDKQIEGVFNSFSQPYQISVTPKGMAPLTTQYGYDNAMNIVSITDSDQRKTLYTYDEQDRLTQIQKPDGNHQSIQYFDASNSQQIEDENGNKTTYTYDANQNLIQARQANFAVANYSYSLAGLTKITDLRGFDTTFTLRSDGKRTAALYPDGSKELWTYDAVGNLTSHTDQKGQQTRFDGYDSQGRPKSITYPDTQVNYTYDTAFKGKVDKVALSSGQWGNIATAYTYDPQGNLVDETRQYPGKSVEIKSSYDDTGLLVSQWNSLSNRTQANTYDSLGRLTKVSYTLNGQPQTVIDNFQYTPTNLLTGYRYPLHNITTELSYNPKTDRITQWKVTGPGAFYVADDNSLATPNTPVMTYISETYDYDPAGNMTKKSSTDGRGILTATDTTYDPINQLTQTLRTTGTQKFHESYRYDTQGNLLQRDPGSAPQKYQIANDSNQITAMWTTPKKGDAGWWDFIYDPNGNLTTKKALTAKKTISTESLIWDAQNHLVRHEFTPENQPMMVQSNRYDLTGLRYKSDTAFNAGILGVWSPLKRTDWTLYDPAQRLIAEEISDTGQNQPTGTNDPNFKELQTIGYINIGLNYAIKVTQRQSPTHPAGPDEITYEHRDPLGTNTQTTTIVPYIDFTLPAGTPHNSSLTLTPFGTIDHYSYLSHGQYPDLPEFTGKRFEPASMMYYFHARYFDPQVGRFIGHDLVEPDLQQPLSLNPFLFCLNNPVNRTDPTGLKDYIYTSKDSVPTIENDWGALEFLHMDRYFADFEGERYLANSRETLTQLEWNQIETNPLWFSDQLKKNLDGASSNPLWVINNSQVGKQMDAHSRLDKEYGSSTLFLFNGKIYNAPEAGNVVWGAGMASLGYTYDTILLGAESYALKARREFDQPNEVKALSAGFWYQEFQFLRKNK